MTPTTLESSELRWQSPSEAAFQEVNGHACVGLGKRSSKQTALSQNEETLNMSGLPFGFIFKPTPKWRPHKKTPPVRRPCSPCP